MMAAAYSSRDVVEGFLHHKLLATPSWRSEPVRSSRRGDAPPGRGSTSPRLQAVLQRAGDELKRGYHGDLAAHASELLLCDGGGAERRRGLTALREELFRDGVNWGRIVAMMELGGALCAQAAQRGGAWRVDDIAQWMEESLDSPPLQGWIEDNGGWDAFVELYGESRPAARLWSTVLGLAVLGAAGLILGVLFAHR